MHLCDRKGISNAHVLEFNPEKNLLRAENLETVSTEMATSVWPIARQSVN